MLQILQEVELSDARVTKRFDCFRGTPKEDVADEFGVRSVNVYAAKSARRNR